MIGAARLKGMEPHVRGTSALLSGATGTGGEDPAEIETQLLVNAAEAWQMHYGRLAPYYPKWIIG